MLIYRDLVQWYHLLDPTEDHEEEAAIFAAAFDKILPPGPATMLELGAGAGNNAYYLNRRFSSLTLTDLSPQMLDLSRALNPDAEHLVADMCALRLERTFDAVMVHDAVAYLTTEDALRACMLTAYLHTRPGGAVIFAPDTFSDDFVESTSVHESADDSRALRTLEWSWLPDPHDPRCVTEYIFAMREGGQVRVVHDHHEEGLFSRETWLRLLSEVGFSAEVIDRPDGDPSFFLCARPA
jgi:SAM-dependent methyltransferase